MDHRLSHIIFLLLICGFSSAQVQPAPGSQLNYTQIMFEHSQVKGADQYLIEVSTDGQGAVSQHTVARHTDSSTASMIGGLEFGRKYIWRYTGLSDGKELGWVGPYDFEIVGAPYVDRNLCRVRVTENDSTANAGGLVILDEARVIVDRAGNFVWYLPASVSARQQTARRRGAPEINDLRFTHQGTLTMINGSQAEERDLRGKLLWQAPDQSDHAADLTGHSAPHSHYNHCFKKLGNGNYMVIDNITVFKPASFFGRNTSDTSTISMADEILQEFDHTGHLVWSWDSDSYLDSAEIQSTVKSAADKELLSHEPGGHMNAFDVDEKSGFVYAGFRHVSRVIKIDKSTGKVTCAWGENMAYHGAKNGDGFFMKQHETTLLHDGSIAVYSNNTEVTDTSKKNIPESSVVIFSQPSGAAASQLLWKYDCGLDPLNNRSGRGGSVDELKNGDLLVCMGTVNDIFEVTRDKRIVWSAVIEKLIAPSIWGRYALYRAHYVSSLYPCYFTIQSSTDTLTRKSPSFRLRVFNDGTESDTYRVSISSVSGHYKAQFTTDVLPGQRSMSFDFAPDKQPAANDKIEVTISSVTDPEFKRVAELVYIK